MSKISTLTSKFLDYSSYKNCSILLLFCSCSIFCLIFYALRIEQSLPKAIYLCLPTHSTESISEVMKFLIEVLWTKLLTGLVLIPNNPTESEKIWIRCELFASSDRLNILVRFVRDYFSFLRNMYVSIFSFNGKSCILAEGLWIKLCITR